MKMQIIVFLALLINIYGCESDNSIENTNILGEDWKVLSIALANNQGVYEVLDKDYFNKDAYLLYFNLDSTFSLNTSVNSYGGKLNISTETKTISFQIVSGTRVGQSVDNVREIDSVFTEVFKATTSYLIVDDEIELIGDKGNINLKKIAKND